MFHGCARFIDDLVCLNDGGEFNDSYKEIYPNELELKWEGACLTQLTASGN